MAFTYTNLNQFCTVCFCLQTPLTCISNFFSKGELTLLGHKLVQSVWIGESESGHFLSLQPLVEKRLIDGLALGKSQLLFMADRRN